MGGRLQQLMPSNDVALRAPNDCQAGRIRLKSGSEWRARAATSRRSPPPPHEPPLPLFLVPLVAQIAAGVRVGEHVFYPVTAPALIVVGVVMTQTVVRIDWGDLTEAAPAFLTLAAMPATFSISHGLAAGFVSYAGMKLAAGRAREAHWLVYAIAVLFAWRYLLLN
jgi:hypothetical protein